MSYLALLFCQDEKTARTVTQVLNELDFQVEPCSETFAAVKKLTTQAFESVVVDCENEENASLLLKAARNSVANQAALMVALVEGQAGVAAAFRIGANLVLTKPIAVEQARSTLRVARGLLRKNAGLANPAAAAATGAEPASTPETAPLNIPANIPASFPATTTTPAAKPVPAPVAAPTPARIPAAAIPARAPATAPATSRPVPPPLPAAPRATPVPPSALRAVASSSSSNLESEAEHQPAPDAASAGLLEALDFKTFEAAPDRSFGLSAPESVSVLEVATGAHEAVRSALAPKQALSSQEFGGFGAAAAPARELAKPPAPAVSTQVADLFEAQVEAPVFGKAASATAAPAEETAPYRAELDLGGSPAASRSKSPLIAVVVLLAFAAALYFGWSQFHKPAGATTATAGPLQPPSPDFGAADAATSPAPSHAVPAATAADSAPVETVNRFSRQSKVVANQVAANQVAANHAATDQVTTPITIAPSRTAPARQAPIQVKTELQRSQPAAAQDAAEAPSIANLGASAKPDALNAIATALPAMPSRQRISQGVSDGLLIKRVQPVYPQQAIQMHTQGMVALQATIAKDGSVRNVKVLSGPAVLGRAATEAVRQWKYKPYTLNGESIEVQTEININFVPPR